MKNHVFGKIHFLVPKEITFKTKPAIALEQLRWACVAGLPRGVVLMDVGYGAYTDLRTNITALGLSCPLLAPLQTNTKDMPLKLAKVASWCARRLTGQAAGCTKHWGKPECG